MNGLTSRASRKSASCRSRPADCFTQTCLNGPADKLKLLAPKALASAPDGALYVADFNLIRKITPDFNVVTLLKLK